MLTTSNEYSTDPSYENFRFSKNIFLHVNNEIIVYIIFLFIFFSLKMQTIHTLACVFDIRIDSWNTNGSRILLVIYEGPLSFLFFLFFFFCYAFQRCKREYREAIKLVNWKFFLIKVALHKYTMILEKMGI